MASNIISGGERRFEALAGGSITSGNMVKWSSNTIVAATDGCNVAGIALESYSSGQTVVVIKAPAVVRLTLASGVDLATGDVVYAASATTVDAGSQNNNSCGRIVNFNPSTAGSVDVQLHTDDSQWTTHA